MVTTFTTSAACLVKAGLNVNSLFTGTSAETNWTTLINEAEALANAVSRVDLVANWANLSTNTRTVLADFANSYAANRAIAYDMGNYPSRIYAETLLDVNVDVVNRILKLLEDKKLTDFIA